IAVPLVDRKMVAVDSMRPAIVQLRFGTQARTSRTRPPSYQSEASCQTKFCQFYKVSQKFRDRPKTVSEVKAQVPDSEDTLTRKSEFKRSWQIPADSADPRSASHHPRAAGS